MVLGSPGRPASPDVSNPMDLHVGNGVSSASISNPFDSGYSPFDTSKIEKDKMLRRRDSTAGGRGWVVGFRLVPADNSSSKALLQPMPTLTLSAFQPTDDTPMSPTGPGIPPKLLLEGDIVPFYESVDALTTHRSSKMLNYPTHMANTAALSGLTDPHPGAPGKHPVLPSYHHVTAVPFAADMLLSIFDQPQIADVEFAVTASPGSSAVSSSSLPGARRFRSVFAQRSVLARRCPGLANWFLAHGNSRIPAKHIGEGNQDQLVGSAAVVSPAVKRILRAGGKDSADSDFSEYIFNPARGRRGRRSPFAFSEFSEGGGSDSGYGDGQGSEESILVVRVEHVSYDAWWWFVRFLYCGEIDGLVGSSVTVTDKAWLADGASAAAGDDSSDASDDLEHYSPSDSGSRPGTPIGKNKFTSRTNNVKRVRTRTDSLVGNEAVESPVSSRTSINNGLSRAGAQSSSELALLRDLYSLSRAFGERVLTAAVLARVAERVEARNVSFWMDVAADEEKWATGLAGGVRGSRDRSLSNIGFGGMGDGDTRKRRRSGKRIGTSPSRAGFDMSQLDGVQVRVGGLAGATSSPSSHHPVGATPFMSPLRQLLVGWIKANWGVVRDCGVWEEWVGKGGDGWESLLTLVVEAVSEVEELEASEN
ncbi:hypothetical protein HDU93_002952 [Gonapodya sp. JEL0774]|nr:hypothetical protein HDU93_002952 [Gonapodya sp. JEL0774]